MGKLTDKEWQKLLERNARHAAHLHIETGNAKKIAEVFKDVPVMKALEYLFTLAEHHRKAKRFKKVKTILEAVALIDRKTGKEVDLMLESKGKGKNQDTTIFVGRLTPAQIFAMPIEVKKHNIKPLKSNKQLSKRTTNKKKAAKPKTKKKVIRKSR